MGFESRGSRGVSIGDVAGKLERMVGQTAGHITSFFIDCYRGLKNLELRDLNDINILTGNNNSGKTSVLELLSSLENPGDIYTWIKMCRLPRNGNFYAGILNLFPINSDCLEIKYAYNHSGFRNIRVSAVVEELRIPESEIDRMNGHVFTDAAAKGDDYLDVKRLDVKVTTGISDSSEYSLYDFQTRVPMGKSSQKSLSAVYISPSAHVDGRLLLDEVMENPTLYQEMMKILREFDDGILNIVQSGNGAEYMILSKKFRKAMPLSVYGDGMKKALALLAAVVKAKDGILLLDEFETAIHTSAMNHIFSWILQSARALNVQVFLSSHSLEAIGKVLRCDAALQDKINLYTLYNKEGKSLVRRMSCQEAVKAQDDWGVELR